MAAAAGRPAGRPRRPHRRADGHGLPVHAPRRWPAAPSPPPSSRSPSTASAPSSSRRRPATPPGASRPTTCGTSGTASDELEAAGVDAQEPLGRAGDAQPRPAPHRVQGPGPRGRGHRRARRRRPAARRHVHARRRRHAPARGPAHRRPSTHDVSEGAAAAPAPTVAPRAATLRVVERAGARRRSTSPSSAWPALFPGRRRRRPLLGQHRRRRQHRHRGAGRALGRRHATTTPTPSPATPGARRRRAGAASSTAVGFDPLAYGIPPASLAAVEPVQLLALEVGAPRPRRRRLRRRGRSTASGRRWSSAPRRGNDLADAPTASAPCCPSCSATCPPSWTSTCPASPRTRFPGVLANVIAGRIANRLDLGGVNYTVDAACASSLAAVDAACKELVRGTSDLVLCGGADLHNGINDYLLFASVHALSPTGPVPDVRRRRRRHRSGRGRRLRGAQAPGRRRARRRPHLRRDRRRRRLQRRPPPRPHRPPQGGPAAGRGSGPSPGRRSPAAASAWSRRTARAPSSATAPSWPRSPRCSPTPAPSPGSVVLGSVKSQIGHTKCAAGLAGAHQGGAGRAPRRAARPPST